MAYSLNLLILTPCELYFFGVYIYFYLFTVIQIRNIWGYYLKHISVLKMPFLRFWVWIIDPTIIRFVVISDFTSRKGKMFRGM